MSTIGTLDESNAALRVLLFLHQRGKPLKQTDLYQEMKIKYGLGRRTVETALAVCLKLDLIQLERLKKAKNQPMPSIFHSLTKKGEKAARILVELEKALV